MTRSQLLTSFEENDDIVAAEILVAGDLVVAENGVETVVPPYRKAKNSYIV